MIKRRPNDYWAMPAWRGVPATAHLHRAHWQALTGELGGLPSSTAGTPCRSGDTLSTPIPEAGLLNMSAVTAVRDQDQLDEMREFVLEHFTRDERYVLMLYYHEGLSYSQIAELLGLPEAAVRAIHQRLKRTLQAKFGVARR